MASVHIFNGNDTRGWVMCVVSAIACVAGACIICVDVVVRLIPGKKNFRIEDSNAFLSASMSLSFGVMIFSSLFSMLPSAKSYLVDDGKSSQAAGFLAMAAFVAGFIGMQVVSRVIHRFMPSHVVDCDHSHGDDGASDDESDDYTERHEPTHALSHDHSHGYYAHSHSHQHQPSHVYSHAQPYTTRGSRSHQPRRLSRRLLLSQRALSHGLALAATESTPLLPPMHDGQPPSSVDGTIAIQQIDPQSGSGLPLLRRPSMVKVSRRLLSFVKDTKSNCDEFGPCYGYSDPCGQECKTHITSRTVASFRSSTAPFLTRIPTATATASVGSASTTTNPTTPTTLSTQNALGGNIQGDVAWNPTYATPQTFTVVSREINNDGGSNFTGEGDHVDNDSSQRQNRPPSIRHDPRDHAEMQEGDPETCIPEVAQSAPTASHIEREESMERGGAASGTASSGGTRQPTTVENDATQKARIRSHDADHAGHEHGHGRGRRHSGHQYHRSHWGGDHDPEDRGSSLDADLGDVEAGALDSAKPHHHHVPVNAFLSIGLQTVLAIALHKFPEGFVMFATNHASPALGLNVFLALFVHNIAEGFSMALPLYMALGSRLRAIFWASILGGLSQPLGAGAAAVWLRYLARGGGESNENGTAYGVLFGVTAGIMVAVALQLFIEGLLLHHNRQLSTGFAFLGMILLGLSNALTH